MAEITATIRDTQGNAKVGWTVQVRLSNGVTVISTTEDGTMVDQGNGSYVTTNSPPAQTYDIYACASGGTPALVKGYDNFRHVEYPLPETMGGTGFTSLQNLPAEIGLEIGSDVQEHSARLDTIVASIEGLNLANADGLAVYDQTNDIAGFATAAIARTAIGLTDSDASRQLLGLEIGSDVQEHSSRLDSIVSSIEALNLANVNGLAVYDQSNDIAAFATAESARIALELGTAAVEDWDTSMTQLAAVGSGLGGNDGFVIHSDGEGIEGATAIQARTLLGLTNSDASRQLLGVAIGVDVQEYSSKLTELSANIADTEEDPGFLVVNGAGVSPDIVDSATARTHLGLGTSATIDSTTSGEANKMVKVSSKGSIVIPLSNATINADASTLGQTFQVLTGNTTTGSYVVKTVVITGVSGGNYTYGFYEIYGSSWGGA